MRVGLVWMALVGCSFSGASPDREVDANTEPVDAAVDSASEDIDAGQVPALSDVGLLARYFIDEAAAGRLVPAVEDAAPQPPPPMTIPILYSDADPTFVEVAGQRGLEWVAVESAGVLDIGTGTVAGAKVRALDNQNTFSFEFVVDIKESSNNNAGSVLAEIVGGGSLPLRITAFDSQRIHAFLDGNQVGDWPLAADAGRVSMHFVVDGQALNPNDRVRLFIGGQRAINAINPALGIGYSLAIPPGSHLTLGNGDDGTASMRGTLHYVAIYTVAVAASVISDHSKRLSASDDG